MQTQIQSVQVYPSLAVILWLADSFATTIGATPVLAYQLRDEQNIMLKDGNVALTEEQWADWTDEETDEDYLLNCACANLSLTRIEPTPEEKQEKKTKRETAKAHARSRKQHK